MKTLHSNLTTIFVLIIAFLIPTLSYGEIHFSQALGMLENTQDDKKHLSPFWGMVALHGKMLQTIRFFGNYIPVPKTPIMDDNAENIRTVDIGKDPIAILIKRLFNSPDGVQFVATTYEADPAGHLSRHLEAINDIIMILDNPDQIHKTDRIKDILDKFIPEIDLGKIDLAKIAKKQLSVEFGSQTDNKILKEIDKIVNLIDKKKPIFVKLLNQKSYDDIKSDAKEKRIPFQEKKETLTGQERNFLYQKLFNMEHSKDALENYSDDDLLKLAKKQNIPFNKKGEIQLKKHLTNEIALHSIEEEKKKELRKYADHLQLKLPKDPTIRALDLKEAIIKTNRASTIEARFSQLSPEVQKKIAFKKFEHDNLEFANQLVKAYDAQKIYADPINSPDQYLYPENIVITSLLTFFIKVADDKSEVMRKLPYLMKDEKTSNIHPPFTLETYNQWKEKLGINKQKLDFPALLKNPELAFLMKQGFEAYENPYIDPVDYRGAVPYGNDSFPDCGETSLRNVLDLFLSAGTGGMITPMAIEELKEKLLLNNPDLILDETTPFIKIANFFQQLSYAQERATIAIHIQWADIVSNLNGGNTPTTLNDIQYGRQLNDSGAYVYEIKSNIDSNVKGIVNMFNVIAKIIPDGVLNENWSQDKSERFTQVATKLNRLCELLSRDGMELTWENEETKDQSITNEFINIIFQNNGTPVFTWKFLIGHFQLDQHFTSRRDWRTSYRNAPEVHFPNEWMANLYLVLNENRLFEEKNYGTKFPLSLIFTPRIRGLNPMMNVLSFIIMRNITQKTMENFFPLIPQWVDKSISLNDNHSLRKISFLFYAANDLSFVKDMLKKPKYESISKRVNILEDQALSDPDELLQTTLGLNSNNILLLISKKPGSGKKLNLRGSQVPDALLTQLTQLTDLDLESNDKISNVGLQNLQNLTRLSLVKNKKISNQGLTHLSNLDYLNLSENDQITDEGLILLPYLTQLFLRDNGVITDEGLARLANLRFLDLGRNNRITDNGLASLKNLKILNLSYNDQITDNGLAPLKNLEILDLSHNDKITDNGLAPLKNLTDLNLNYNTKITMAGLLQLPKLTTLSLTENYKIKDQDLTQHPNFKMLKIIRGHL